MFSKVGKYSVCFVLFIFIMTLTAEAFTVVRQEELGGDRPMTRSRRKMRQRAVQGQDFESSQSSSSYTSGNNESNNSSSTVAPPAPSGNFVTPSETPTPTPTVDQEVEQEKRDKARKTSNMIVIIMVLLIVGGLAGWYFTRNVNFKKMKQ